VMRATVVWLRATLEADSLAARAADEIAGRRKSMRTLLQKWAELAARTGPGPGAAGILARERVSICETVRNGTGGGAFPKMLPAAAICRVVEGGGLAGCSSGGKTGAGGKQGSLDQCCGVHEGEMGSMSSSRVAAHEAAQADGGRRVAPVALIFAQLRVECDGNKDSGAWRARQKAETHVPPGAGDSSSDRH
jgi:hypothetical protein